jgi:hypothetical protein
MTHGKGWAKGLGLLLVLAAMHTGLQAAMPLAKNPPKVFIDANRTRFTKVAGGDWDDRQQKVQLEVIVRNLDLNKKSVDGLTMYYWAMAQSLLDKRSYKVIDSGSFEVKLDNSAEGREIHHKGEMLTLEWDDTGAIFGVRYKGYVIVLVNAQREVIAVKANQPQWQTNFERAFNLHTGSWCGLDLAPVAKPGD